MEIIHVSKIEAETAEALARGAGWFTSQLRHRAFIPPASSDSSQQEEQPMTTPQQPQRNIFADVASVLTEVAGNPLMVRLARERLGELLTADDIEHVVSIVRRIEDGEHAAAVAAALHQQRTEADNSGQPVPQFTPHDDGTQVTADGQHQQ